MGSSSVQMNFKSPYVACQENEKKTNVSPGTKKHLVWSKSKFHEFSMEFFLYFTYCSNCFSTETVVNLPIPDMMTCCVHVIETFSFKSFKHQVQSFTLPYTMCQTCFWKSICIWDEMLPWVQNPDRVPQIIGYNNC